MGQVAILHGWSDRRESFHPLRDFLAGQGYQLQDIFLADYLSLEDDVRISDVARRMGEVVDTMIASGRLRPPFDLIVHSTGGLVARDWISHLPPDRVCPVKRLVMLAPANFGSRLAKSGKSLVGRVFKGWDNWFETGQEMLNGLELASAYQWDLARRDLLDPNGDGRPGPYGPGRVLPFVITGTRPYSDFLRQVVNEPGGDGTIRVASANLNVHGYTLDFRGDPKTPELRAWVSRAGQGVAYAFAVLPDRDHSSIIDPSKASGASSTQSDRLGKLIVDALKTDDQDYGARVAEWHAITEATGDLDQPGQKARDDLKLLFPNGNAPEQTDLRRHMQFVVRAVDDRLEPVRDYFLEFFSGNEDTSMVDDTVAFQQKVLRHVGVNSLDASRRCLYIDRVELQKTFYTTATGKERRLFVSISAAPVGENVGYFDDPNAAGSVAIHAAVQRERDKLEVTRLHRNSTHLVEMILPRKLKPDGFRF